MKDEGQSITGAQREALHRLAQEDVTLQVKRRDAWRLRRLNQIVQTLKQERHGVGLIWVQCDGDDVRMGIVDVYRIIAEVLHRFEP